VTRPSWLVPCALAAWACRAGPGAPVPRDPPETLRVIAEDPATPRPAEPEDPQEEPTGFPQATEPLRRDPCGIPIGVAPESLMTAEGIGAVQRRLVEEDLLDADAFDRGLLDEPTLDAIRALQRREELPDVGLPTYATVRALGIDLDDVFLTGDPRCEPPGKVKR
jgi:hypothetical protein